MNVLIAGASGFIGQALVASLREQHHRITVLGRNEQNLQKQFGSSAVHCVAWSRLDTLKAADYNSVINLCGHNIAATRWNEAVKKLLIESRVTTTDTLVNWAIRQKAKPHFYNASAVGIYGLQDPMDKNAFDENNPIDFQKPVDFLNKIGIAWENALNPAREADIPVTVTRFGVVLQRRQGILKKMVPAFYVGLGSVIGEGTQVISWIHIHDIVKAFQFLLERPELTGAFNLTSPNPVTQAEFAKTLAKSMHRPLLLKTPAFVIRTMFGEMGDTLLLKGQRVLPHRLTELGFSFQYPTIESALEQEM